MKLRIDRRALPALCIGIVLIGSLGGRPALAQTVTLYGTLDASLAVTRNGAPGAGSVTGVQSGVLTASRWGLRGSEDMGGGLRAIFGLEGGIDVDTGNPKTFSGNPSTATLTAPNGTPSLGGWNRRAFVGIEGGAGSLTLGRDYAPAFYAGLVADAFRYGGYGNLQSLVGPAGGSERWARVSNGLFYTSSAWSGFRGRMAYSFGSESPGVAGGLPKGANAFAGFGAEYVIAGLTLVASHQNLRFPTVAGTPAAFTGARATRRDTVLGGAYRVASYTFSGGGWEAGSPQNARAAWLGVSAALGQNNLLLQLQKLRQDAPTEADRKASVFGVLYLYNLSRRTTLYANYGKVSNNAAASFALASSDTAVAPGAVGADPAAMAFGIRHNF